MDSKKRKVACVVSALLIMTVAALLAIFVFPNARDDAKSSDSSESTIVVDKDAASSSKTEKSKSATPSVTMALPIMSSMPAIYPRILWTIIPRTTREPTIIRAARSQSPRKREIGLDIIRRLSPKGALHGCGLYRRRCDQGIAVAGKELPCYVKICHYTLILSAYVWLILWSVSDLFMGS